MSRVVAVRKDETGKITDYKLENGKVLNHQEALIAVDSGEISDCAKFTTGDGGEAIRSNRGIPDYSLSDLPTF